MNTVVKPQWDDPVLPSPHPSSFMVLKPITDRYEIHRFDDFKAGNYNRLIYKSREEFYKESFNNPFENRVSFIRKAVQRSDSLNHLKHNLMSINRWCFLNVGPGNYGFYNPRIDKENNIITIVENSERLYLFCSAVFKHSDDAMVFKMKFC